MSHITNDIDMIINQLLSGNVAALPTETVYGLAADATNSEAVEKIFKIKKRPINHPLIMHVAPDWNLTEWIETIPEYANNLMKAFWPGPLTFVFRLKKEANISRLVTGNQHTIAIRSPAHPLTLEILNKLNRPLVAPSANPFGKVSPTEAQHVMQDFPDHAFFILEGGYCDVGIESTILNCVDKDSCHILRPGTISQSDIQGFCDVLQCTEVTSTMRVSGNLKSHYQPKKPLYYVNSEDLAYLQENLSWLDQVDVLSFSLPLDKMAASYCFSTNPKTAAKEFYRQLRNADRSNNHLILIELPPRKPEWSALTERIKKAGVCLRSIDNKLTLPDAQ